MAEGRRSKKAFGGKFCGEKPQEKSGQRGGYGGEVEATKTRELSWVKRSQGAEDEKRRGG